MCKMHPNWKSSWGRTVNRELADSNFEVAASSPEQLKRISKCYGTAASSSCRRVRILSLCVRRLETVAIPTDATVRPGQYRFWVSLSQARNESPASPGALRHLLLDTICSCRVWDAVTGTGAGTRDHRAHGLKQGPRGHNRFHGIQI
jgi:hypothetical protein